MDHISIPSFALLRYGTVIVRLKMEKFSEHFLENCHQAGVRPKDVSGVVHRVSSCEHCTRTRIVSQCSDCDDSVLVGKCRPYRTRAAQSRYVNVCAAVCLLLLVGGLAPQSSAAPHLTRTMDRTKRASDQENETWSNPCDLDLSSGLDSFDYKPNNAEQVSKQAKSVLAAAKMYERDIANLHSFQTFESMLDTWRNTEWLRKQSWFRDEVLPREKEIGQLLDNKTGLNKLLLSEELDKVLPVMTKAMKMLAAGLQAVAGSLLEADTKERLLIPKLTNTSENMRSVLCLTSEVLRGRKLKMLPLLDSEIPQYKSHEDVTTDVFLIYRDTINFLEYVDQFFSEMSKIVTK